MGEHDRTVEEAVSPGRGASPRDGVNDRVMLASVAERLFGTQDRALTRAGRFVVLDRIGEGGMGTVFRAHDPELDRRVALKVLKPNVERGDQARARLQKEAVALARLNHPNVVAVYEVGTVRDELFIAMEYVEGIDLRQWTEQNPVGTRVRLLTALRLLRAAGKGLAAAHLAELVHRDFKPSNVLVGDDGRVRVVDFGLARGEAAALPSFESGKAPRGSGEVLRDPSNLTQTGATVGTPAFMPPEQQRGSEVDARGDQFAFCVAAWRVLFGAAPWRGVFPDPEREPPTAPAGAPRWLVDVLSRGIAADPDERYPSMAPLLRALRRDPRRRRIVLAAAGTVLAATAIGVGAYAYNDQTLCTDGPAQMSEVWNAQARQELATRVSGADPVVGADVWERIDALLQAAVDGWLSTYEEVCDAGRRRDALTPEQLDAALSCLAIERSDLEAVLGVLGQIEQKHIDRAVDVTVHFRDADRCADPILDDALPLSADPNGTQAVLEAFKGLRVARILRGLGDEPAALAQFASTEPQLAALEHPQLQLRATLFRAKSEESAGRARAAIELARPAYDEAIRRGDDRSAWKLAWRIASISINLNELDEAEVWMGHARALSERVGSGKHARRILANTQTRLCLHRGDFVGAVRHAERALQFTKEAAGENHPASLPALSNLAIAKMELDEHAEGLALSRRSLALNVATYGPRSTQALTMQANVAHALSSTGETTEGVGLMQETLETARARFGSQHPRVILMMNGVAASALDAALFETAIQAARETEAALVRANAARTENALMNGTNLAEALGEAGRLEEAERIASRTVQGMADALGTSHTRRGTALRALGVIQLERGRLEEAEKSLEEAETILTGELGLGHTDTLRVKVAQARLQTAQGAPGLAVTLLDSIVAEASPHVPRCEGLLARATALREVGRLEEALDDTSQALRLAKLYPIALPKVRALRAHLLLGLGQREEAAAEVELGLEEVRKLEHPMGARLLESARKAAVAVD